MEKIENTTVLQKQNLIDSKDFSIFYKKFCWPQNISRPYKVCLISPHFQKVFYDLNHYLAYPNFSNRHHVLNNLKQLIFLLLKFPTCLYECMILNVDDAFKMQTILYCCHNCECSHIFVNTFVDIIFFIASRIGYKKYFNPGPRNRCRRENFFACCHLQSGMFCTLQNFLYKKVGGLLKVSRIRKIF